MRFPPAARHLRMEFTPAPVAASWTTSRDRLPLSLAWLQPWRRCVHHAEAFMPLLLVASVPPSLHFRILLCLLFSSLC